MAKILVVRLDGIGDALVCAPLIIALRDAGHAVGIALSDRNAGIFAPAGFLACHVLERIPWPRHGSTVESARRARAQIKALRYDVALVVSEEPEAYLLARGIPRRIGFTTGWAKPLKSWWVRRQLTATVLRGASIGAERAHEVEVVFRLAAGSGLHAEAAPTRDPARLRALIVGPDGHGGAPAAEARPIVLQLGTKWEGIGLDPASAGALVASLAARGAQLVTSLAERDVASRLSAGAPFIVCPDVASWKRAVAGARAVVTPDTGAAHLAGMLGIPTVDCFPDADAPAQIARWHPWAAPYTTFVASELRGGAGAARIEKALDAL